MKVAVFSGRFDPPHLGHINTITSLAKSNDYVVVPVLDTPNRECVDAEIAAEIMAEVLSNCMVTNVAFFVIGHHFANITKKEYCKILDTVGVPYKVNDVVYYSGNEKVLENMDKQKIKYEYRGRSFPKICSGTVIRKGLK